MDTTQKKKVLGKGIGALMGQISNAPATKKADEKFRLVPIDDISPNPSQPRKTFSDASLEELASSIREKGVIEPLIIRRTPLGYELIAGERRLRASRLAGLKEVPAVLIEATDEESLELAIIENIQREDLNAIEEAEAYKTLLDFCGSQEEVAKRVGKDRATVANYLRLLKLSSEVKAELAKDAISMGHARAILSLESHSSQVELCRQIITKGLSVREAERLAKSFAPQRQKAKKSVQAPVELKALEDSLRGVFGTKVSLVDKKGKGRVEIHYYSVDERERILELLTNNAR